MGTFYVLKLFLFFLDHCRRYTVNEIISMLDDEGGFERADIHLQPPPVDELTDEDSASEDEEVGYNNLSGRQLDQPASATIIRLDGRHVVDSPSDPELVSCRKEIK